MDQIEALLGSPESLDRHLAIYRENPYLLDPFFGQLVAKLAAIYLKGEQWPLDTIYTLANVRGAKHTSKFLDTSPALFEQILGYFAEQTQWKRRYSLLLWLANLLLIPMKLSVLGIDFTPLYNLLLSELSKVSKERDAAALAMARLLTREQSKEPLELFWSEQTSTNQSSISLGVLQTLAHVSKTMYIPPMLSIAGDATVVEQRLVVKIRARASLLAFPSEWSHYESTINFLYEKLGSESTVLRYSSAKALARLCSQCHSRPSHAIVAETLVQDTLEGFMADRLVSSIPGGALSQVSDDMWHGSLLFIAELLRVKVPIDLAPLFGILEEALHFEQKRLGYATGTNVRDAACYVCWAVFRQRKIDLKLERIYSELISLACFDREVNVRRAAAAALQEGLGRHQGMPAQQVLAILEQLNFASVANIAHCYLKIAPALQGLVRVDRLLQRGVASWDVAIQRLASSALCDLAGDWSDLVPQLLTMYQGDQDCKVGVLMALGKLGEQERVQGRTFKLPTEQFLEHELRSETVCEALLIFLQCVDPAEASPVALRCMWATSPEAIEAVARLRLPFDEAWLGHVNQPCCIQALASCGYKLETLDPPSDPLARSIYIRLLERSPQSEQRVLDGLEDYQRDKRGDVGSWVRLEAIQKARDWGLRSPALWRMASECLDKVRRKSVEALQELGFELVVEPQLAFIESLLETGPSDVVLPGLVSSIGGRSGNAQLAEAAYEVVKRRHLDQVVALGWKGELGLSVLRTVLMALREGIKFDQHQLLRLAYNSTINTPQVGRVLAGIEVLAFLDVPKSRARLGQLCGHSQGAVRVRAAEALFELGVETVEVMETDFSVVRRAIEV